MQGPGFRGNQNLRRHYKHIIRGAGGSLIRGLHGEYLEKVVKTAVVFVAS